MRPRLAGSILCAEACAVAFLLLLTAPAVADQPHVPPPGLQPSTRQTPDATETEGTDPQPQVAEVPDVIGGEGTEPEVGPAEAPEIQIPGATVVYYDVHGSTAEELRAQLDELGPVTERGVKVAGKAEWNLTFRWSRYRDEPCRISDVLISYEVTVLMPRWIPEGDMDVELSANWERFIAGLTEHEATHVAMLAASVQAESNSIIGIPCDEAQSAAASAAARIYQVQYDLDVLTRDGATQGAVFP